MLVVSDSKQDSLTIRIGGEQDGEQDDIWDAERDGERGGGVYKCLALPYIYIHLEQIFNHL